MGPAGSVPGYVVGSASGQPIGSIATTIYYIYIYIYIAGELVHFDIISYIQLMSVDTTISTAFTNHCLTCPIPGGPDLNSSY
jgi:hypothetical protein